MNKCAGLFLELYLDVFMKSWFGQLKFHEISRNFISAEISHPLAHPQLFTFTEDVPHRVPWGDGTARCLKPTH